MVVLTGQVKWFNQTKGFGFIEIQSGKEEGSDIFVHAADVEGRPLRDEDKVEFEIGDDRGKGRRAQKVTGGTGRHDDVKGGGKGKDRYGDSGYGKGGGYDRYDSYKGSGKGRSYDRYDDRRDDRRGGRDDRYDDRRGAREEYGGGKGDSGGKGGKGVRKAGDWDCASCDFMNFASRDKCKGCGAPKGAGKGGRSDSRGRGAAKGGRSPEREPQRSRSRGRGRSGSR